MGKRLSLCLSMVLVLAATAVQAETISGRVYYDADADGRYDFDDTSLRGVCVTDGVGFARTNRRGVYRLDIQKDPVLEDGGRATIAISCPNRYRPESNWFYYLDEIEAGKKVDFRLVPDKQTMPFTFIQGTDSHVPRGGPEKFIGFRKDVEAMSDEVAFCILTGDLVNLSDSHSFAQGKEQWDFYAEHTRDFPVPLYALSGNHDIAGVRDGDPNRDRKDPTYAYGFYTENVGPLRWSFDYARIHFVGIDFNHKDDKGKWQWGIPETALKWLDMDLARLRGKKRIFLFVHHPSDWASLEPIVTKYNVERIFHGHDHVERTRDLNDVEVISSGSISEIFNDKDRTTGYRIVHALKDGIDSFYRPTGSPHAISIDYPRFDSKVKAGEILNGSFYDPEEAIKELTVCVGDRDNVVPFTRGPACCRFELPLNELPETGGLDVTASVTDGEQSWTFSWTYTIQRTR